MTPGEIAVWRAVYAASWHQTMGVPAWGLPSDVERALWSAQQADRAVAALAKIEHDSAIEVLR